MSNPVQQHCNKWMIAASFIACSLFAIGSEWSQFHFIYGLSFSLTSLFVLLSVRLFGIWGGLLTAIIAYCAGTLLMQQPWIHITAILEAAFVGFLLRRYSGKLFFSDAFFWLLIGIPFVYFIYSHQYPDGMLNVKLIACIIAVNGLFNSLFAEIAHQYLPLRRWSGLSRIKRLPSSITQLLLHLTLGIVIMSFLLNMFVSSISSFKEVSLYSQRIAQTTVSTVMQEWKATGGPYATPLDQNQTRQLQYIIDRYTSMDKNSFSFTDHNHMVIASSQHELISKRLNPWEDKPLIQINDVLYLSAPDRVYNPIQLYTWHKEHFLYKSDLSDGSGQFLVSIPISNYQNYLFNKYVTHVIFLIGFAMVAACIALFINRSFARSLQRLAVSTTNFPLKLVQNNILDLPKSSVAEIHSLITNFKHMANNLLHLFHESQSNNERLQSQSELLRQSEERLHQLAYYDMLTGLPNRLQFTRHFQELITISSGKESLIAILFVDINRFKQINDTLGHSSGDSLLQLAADRFQDLTSKTCSVFRLGGDEFVFVAQYAEEDELERYAQSIRDSFIEPYILDGAPIFLTVSVGISVYPRDGADKETIIRNADIAMYNAKEQGDGCYRFFHPTLMSVITEKMRLENGMYKALQENQFSLYYQPKVCATNGELCGIEALIRWKHPELGLVPPDKFIPLAEQSGFILEIDSWVFHEACRQNKAWQDAGLKKIPVSVNISARHFYQGNLKETIEKGLRETGLEPQYVSLEITEGVFMRNMDLVIETILYLRKLGIQISLDDFGTGYSSLNQLQRLPITDVKLDRSFIQGITSDDKKSSIVKAIIELVHSMNMKVIAEGVETAEESQFCKDMKCDELQGYLFSRPLPAEQLESLLGQEVASGSVQLRSLASSLEQAVGRFKT